MASYDIQHVPAPWKLKGTIYTLLFWSPKSQADSVAAVAYSPLEASSTFASSNTSGRPLGGLSMIQIIRYSESPVGPYDELVICPGYHEYVVDGEDGRRVTKKNVRVTRVYVSQKHTCWNGRRNWNIAKHLAAFDWHTRPDGSTTVKVYPHDVPASWSEPFPSAQPFFEASFKPVPYLPSFPSSLKVAKFFGLDVTLVHPPLPEGPGSQGELPGTDKWCSVLPAQSARRTCIGWFDLQQQDQQQDQQQQHANFWPGLGRWHLGIRMDDATIEFPEATYWDPPWSVL